MNAPLEMKNSDSYEHNRTLRNVRFQTLCLTSSTAENEHKSVFK